MSPLQLIPAALRRRSNLRREDGVALVLALGIIAVFTIIVATAIEYSASNQRSAQRASAAQTAYSLAEAGVNNAESLLNAASNAASPTMLGCSASLSNPQLSAAPCTPIPITVVEGSASFYGLYSVSGTTGIWTISSTGSTRNSSGNAPVTRTLTATVSVTGGGQSNNISVWNYVYSTATPGAGCEVDLNGDHAVVNVPLYVTGDLCVSGDHAAVIEDQGSGGQAVDVRVGGTLKITGGHATVGQLGHPLTSGIVTGGCITNSIPAAHACSAGDSYYVSTTDTALNASPPTTDFAGWYQNASPGPRNPCTSTANGFPPLPATSFDNDATMNGTNASFNLTQTNADYSCVTSTGSLIWDHTHHYLQLSGTVFFDGNVSLNDGGAYYHGLATVYVNGTLSFNNGRGSAAGLHAGCPSSPAAPTGKCAFNQPVSSGGWDTTKDMVIFAVNKASGTAVDLSVDHSEFQGDLLCNSGATANLGGDHTAVEGGIICGRFTWGAHTQVYPLPRISNLPPGAPVPPNAPATISRPTFKNG